MCLVSFHRIICRQEKDGLFLAVAVYPLKGVMAVEVVQCLVECFLWCCEIDLLELVVEVLLCLELPEHSRVVEGAVVHAGHPLDEDSDEIMRGSDSALIGDLAIISINSIGHCWDWG